MQKKTPVPGTRYSFVAEGNTLAPVIRTALAPAPKRTIIGMQAVSHVPGSSLDVRHTVIVEAPALPVSIEPLASLVPTVVTTRVEPVDAFAAAALNGCTWTEYGKKLILAAIIGSKKERAKLEQVVAAKAVTAVEKPKPRTMLEVGGNVSVPKPRVSMSFWAVDDAK